MSFKKKKVMSQSIQSVLGGHPRVSRRQKAQAIRWEEYGSWPTDDCRISQEGEVNFEVKCSEFIMF